MFPRSPHYTKQPHIHATLKLTCGRQESLTRNRRHPEAAKETSIRWRSPLMGFHAGFIENRPIAVNYRGGCFTAWHTRKVTLTSTSHGTKDNSVSSNTPGRVKQSECQRHLGEGRSSHSVHRPVTGSLWECGWMVWTSDICNGTKTGSDVEPQVPTQEALPSSDGSAPATWWEVFKVLGGLRMLYRNTQCCPFSSPDSRKSSPPLISTVPSEGM